MRSVLITGANGFVGKALCQKLCNDGWCVRGVHRPGADLGGLPKDIETRSVTSIDAKTDWKTLLQGVDTVVHLAARVHVMKEVFSDPFPEYRNINVDGTGQLASAASKAGVKRFVFISSVKVNGEENQIAYCESDLPKPEGPYARSKWMGEKEVLRIAEESGMASVIIRPPLVYGPDVRANFLTLMRLVDLMVPMPIANVANRRSMIYLENLLDCISTCLTHPAAAGQIYLVSDDRDLSTPELVRLIAKRLQKKTFLFPFPPGLLHCIGQLVGKTDAADRLLGSLSVDISKIKNELGWQPPYAVETGLSNTVRWYKGRNANVTIPADVI